MSTNLTDIQGTLKTGAENGDRLYQIFEKQSQLMDKYEQIEFLNGLLQTSDIPVDLDDRFGQARLKDFAWRITEELAEVIDSKGDPKEMADVLHFLVEYTILAGYYPEDIVSTSTVAGDLLSVLYEEAVHNIQPIAIHPKYIPNAVGLMIESLGMLNNCLKNKPWKQSFKPTDQELFHLRLMKTWSSFMTLVVVADMSDQYLYDNYFGKAHENVQRQETGY